MQPIDASIILQTPAQLRELADLLEKWEPTESPQAADRRVSDVLEKSEPATADDDSAADRQVSDVLEKSEPAADSAAAGDMTGRPWDARIDSANKTLTSGGLWRAKKGVSKEERQAVIANWEQSQQESAPEQSQQESAPEQSQQELDFGSLFGAPPPAPAPAPAPAESQQPLDWPTFISTITQHPGGMDATKISEYLAANSVVEFADLVNRPELWAGYLTHVGVINE